MGGLSRRYVKIQEIRDAGKDPLIVDAGDLFFSTTRINDKNKKSEEYRASAILEGFNKIGCDAINIGKYELLNGLSFLNEMTTKIEAPFLSANLKSQKTKELLFKPYHILKKSDLTFGIIGVTNQVPDTSTMVIADDFIEAGNYYINEIKNQVDIIIMLVNADRGSQADLVEKFEDADFIITSGSTNMTRTNSPQKTDGPFKYSCGKQGKYLMVVDVEMNDKNSPLVDISNHKKKIKDINKRFERLQKKDPKKSLEEIYSDQSNVLKLIKQYEKDLEIAENAIENALNTIKFETIGLNKKVKDDPGLLAFVDSSLAKCNALNPEKNKQFNGGKKNSKIDHSGHNH
ncbi:MAG: hypothetical protein CMG55_09855 [Candidatus Marinimicrobia bacterium]|nr:hypothetical protein [Candidatus Neomarinimicrobiota bacterium]|tara:strand:+ start:1138 stop:2172 length:1035 start_codon:yes stop_codon:yes gene_type:complete